MTRSIEFLYDFGSPNAYLVHKVLPAIARKHGVAISYLPILLGGVFKETNNKPPMQAFAQVKNKLAHQMRETERFVERYQVPYGLNPFFPVMTLGVMRGAVFARGHDWEARYIDVVFDAMWREGAKMDDAEVITRVLQDADLPAAHILAATQTPKIKTGLLEATHNAVERGVFGAPTMFVGDEMFFGKDSLDELDWWLGRSPD